MPWASFSMLDGPGGIIIIIIIVNMKSQTFFSTVSRIALISSLK